MSNADLQSLLTELVAACNQGDLAAFDRLLLPDYFGYVPQAGEPAAPQACTDIGRALRGACPDLRVTLGPLSLTDDGLSGPMTVEGTFTGSLWGAPGDGAPHSLSGMVVARGEGERLALRWEQMNFVSTLRGMGVMPQPEKAHLRPAHSVTMPEIVLRLIHNGMKLQEKPCGHLDRIRVTEPDHQVCEDCVASGDEWPALRMCLECGYVGCCDVAVNKHMKKHCAATGHVIFRSIQPGEAWLWCYADSAFLASRHLPGHAA